MGSGTGRRRARAVGVVSAVMAVAAGLWVVVARPPFGGAQPADREQKELEQADRALSARKAAVTTLEAQVAALSNAPAEVAELLDRVKATLDAEEAAVTARDAAAARGKAGEGSQQLARLGRHLQKELALQAEVPDDGAVYRATYARVNARDGRIRARATQQGIRLDVADTDRAGAATLDALAAGELRQARTALSTYIDAVEALEESLRPTPRSESVEPAADPVREGTQ